MANVCGAYAPILTQEEWEALYPKEQYPGKGKRFTLHFLLALNQPEETIVKYISDLKKDHFQKLTLADPDCEGLTPLHIAAMKAHTAVVRALLARPEVRQMIDQRDRYGWTALHHALIASQEIFDLLVANGADPMAATASRGNIEDLRMLTGRVSPSACNSNVLIMKEGNAVPLSSLMPQELNSATGLQQCCAQLLFIPESYKQLWQQEIKIDISKSPFLAIIDKNQQNLWEQLSTDPVNLIVDECRELKGKVPLPLELRSLDCIPMGRPIGEYAGVVKTWERCKRFVDAF